MTPVDLSTAFARTLRQDFRQPGFAVLTSDDPLTPSQFRAWLLAIADDFDQRYRREYGRRLVIRSLDRFDQQNSTLPHLDGGPDESLLLLGYEPTLVRSELSMVDYSKAADERGLEPRTFLAMFNPIVPAHRTFLAAYATPVEPFDGSHYRVVLINNGSVPADRRHTGLLGVLHQAVVPVSDPNQSRVINSLMLMTAPLGSDQRVPASARQAYIAEGTPFVGN